LIVHLPWKKQDMEKPLVSIIILNWNGDGLIQECLSSLAQLEYAPIEIIVIDNGSIDSSLPYLLCQKSILLIENKENTGFAKGNNIGFSRASGKYIAVLNNDTTVDATWLNNPVQFLEQDDRIGSISCRQMNFMYRGIIDVLYHTISKDLSFYPFGRGIRIEDLPEALKPGFVLSASGGSAIYRKNMIDKIGGFDERFFAYGEDADLSMRAFINGWKCMYVPSAVVYHKGSASFSKVPEKISFYGRRNKILLRYKYFSWFLILRYLPWIINEEKRTFYAMMKNKNSRIQYFSIWKSVFTEIRKFSRERHINIQKLNKLKFSINKVNKRHTLSH
jgi:GT2 family glycosyltransferase